MNPELLAALTSSAVRLDYFLLVYAQSTPIRLFTGFSPFNYAGDDVDPSGGVYLGFGRLTEVPALTQLINGAAQRIEFVLSGVDADVMALADEEAPTLRDADAFVGVGIWNEDYELISGGVVWLWEGVSDAPRIALTTTEDEAVRKVILSVGSPSTSRRRPRFGYWTDLEHQADFPGDTFFQNVARYSANTTVRFPS